jgi:hypothetical protein
VRNGWLAERLAMNHEVNVTAALRRVRESKGPESTAGVTVPGYCREAGRRRRDDSKERSHIGNSSPECRGTPTASRLDATLPPPGSENAPATVKSVGDSGGILGLGGTIPRG